MSFVTRLDIPSDLVRPVDIRTCVASISPSFSSCLRVDARRWAVRPASTQPEMARTNETKRRDEYLESGRIQRSLPRVSGRSTTSRITHIVHGAGIADEAEAPRDHTEVGQKLTRSSARDECPPSVWTIASSARRTWAQMVRQSRRWRIHFL